MKMVAVQEIGRYIHRDGRRVKMKTGLFLDGKKRAKVFFYQDHFRRVYIDRNELRRNWYHECGHHIFGAGAGPQSDWLSWHECNREERYR